jgi:hypothetical protein
MDVHHEAADGASGSELDFGMAPAHAWEAIHAVDDDLVSAASDALHGNRIATESRDEAIPLFRLAGPARDDSQSGNEKWQGLKRSLQNHMGSFDSHFTEMPDQRIHTGTILHNIHTAVIRESVEQEFKPSLGWIDPIAGAVCRPFPCSGAQMSQLTRFRPVNSARRFSPALCLLLLAAVSLPAIAQTPDQGTWRIYYEPSRDRVELSFEQYENGARRHGMTSFGVRPAELRGLPLSQLSSYNGPARFQLVRDAGTFNFEGQLRDGHGTGFFTFSPDSRFPQQLASRGYERPTTEQQFWLAMHDVGYAMLDELRAEKYDRPSVDQLVVMGMHGANLDYMKSLSTAGYRVGNTHRLVALRDHGVSREFIGGLTDAGYSNLSLDDLQELRDHGVTPDFIASLRRFGFTRLTTNQLLAARDHGVTESFVEDFRDLGYTNLALRDFVRLRDHGVTPAFARNQRESNGGLVGVEDLIRRRDRGDY